MIDYHLYNLNPSDFEKLINIICQKILGTGVISFSEGKDGGRDGKFVGKAENYPSTNSTWSGSFTIQAKHTSNPIASCSDADFQKLIEVEAQKIKKLRSNNEIDNYLLFTNRKYTGIKGEELCKKITEISGLQNVAIIGKETISDLYLNPNKQIVRQFNLNRINIPFDFSDEEIKEIILAFKKQLPKMNQRIVSKSEELKYNFDHIKKEDKNKKNNLSNEYYEQQILGNSLVEFGKIETFLNDPLNEDLKDYYYDTAHELNQIISLKREDFDGFEELFIHIYNLVSNGVSTLKGSKRHITTFLHYMYMECLIGKK